MTIASYEASATQKDQENYGYWQHSSSKNTSSTQLKLESPSKISSKHHGMAYYYKSKHSIRTWTFFCLALLFLVGRVNGELQVNPLASELVGTLDSSISLVCSSSAKPILCLWKTPYGHVYTLSEGVFAESGRLRHKDDSSGDECGLEIVGVEQQDDGRWECEVGSLIGDTFQTATADINLQVKRQSQTFHEGQTSRQEVGNDVILHCSADREVHLCRWKTPYLNTYIVGEGIYVERGRIQWLGKDPNFDCTIRVANLDLRDAGTWVCEIGSSTKESFQVQTKEFVIDIETPLKLSAPTALMQNANTDATLVCHANKPYDDCLWTTPYGQTYAFPDQTSSHEGGRIAYFGFADTDCGVIVRNVQPKDNGGWQCQLHSRNGDIFQNASDIVSLFAESTGGRPEVAAQPRSIADYDYTLKSIDYDASDYIDGGDFDRVQGNPSQQRPTKIQLIPPSSFEDKKKETTTTRSRGTITHNGGRPSESSFNLSDFEATPSGLPPPIELSRITPATSGGHRGSSSSSSTTSQFEQTTSSAAPLSVLDSSSRDALSSEDFAGVNPLELELLSRISGTRRDSRPIRIGANAGAPGQRGQSPNNLINAGIVFESTKTTTSLTTTSRTTSSHLADTTNTNQAATSSSSKASNADSMRQLEIQRIREERRKAAREKQERENERLQEAVAAAKAAAEAAAAEAAAKKEAEEKEQQRQRQLVVERKRLEERRRKMEEQRRKEAEEREKRRKEAEEREKKRKEAEERERIRKEEEEKLKKEQEEAEKKRKEQEAEEERLKKLEEERQRKLEEERQRKIQQERRRKMEEERKRKIAEEQEKKRQEEARQRKLEEERQRKLAEEEEKKKKAEEEERQKRLEEEKRQKQIQEERRRKAQEEERKRKAEAEKRRKQAEARERRRKEREEREKRRKEREEREKKRKEEAERKKKEEEEKKRQEEVQRRREEARKQREEELKKQREEERRQKEIQERRRKEEEERRKALEAQKLEEEKKKKAEEEQKRRDAEIRRRLEVERKRKEDEEKRLAEIERKRKEELQKEREALERKRKEEEERLMREIQRKKKEEEERRKAEEERKAKEEAEIARKFEEARRKEEEEKKRIEEEKREEARKRRIERQRKRDEAERQRKLEAEKQRKEEEERQKRLEEEKAREDELRRKADQLKKQREDERRKSLERIRQERIKEEQEEARIAKQQEDQARRQREEELRKQIEAERRKKAEDQQRQFAGTIQQSSNRQPDLDRASLIPRTESPRSFPTSFAGLNLPGTELEGANQKRCYVNARVVNGNVTCENHLPDAFGEYSIGYNEKCDLSCKSGYVSVFQKEALCQNGRLTPRLDCVRPDALLLLAGRSDTHGVLNTVELVTNRGVCRGAVPTLPAMRWRMIAESIDKEHVLACGGVNIFGDPKKHCWTLGFAEEPFWSEAPNMLVARDAAAWALEGNFLIVLGGSLGKLNGYTDSVEMHNVKSRQWIEGPRMSSSRYSHCAVGLGNGSIIVTGGYGGLDQVERLDIDTGKWWPLPELNPVRAQHGCAIVDLDGEQGVLVVGGDSGGTRLKDVRFLPIEDPASGWRKVADLNTARWGRPGVAMVGGRITVAAGWDGVRDLATVEYYDEKTQRWRLTASRLQFERRWPASTPISLSLFPKCAQKRER